jgi:hypothetical protein
MAGLEFGRLAGVDHDGAGVDKNAPHVLGADLAGLLVRLGQRRLIDG